MKNKAQQILLDTLEEDLAQSNQKLCDRLLFGLFSWAGEMDKDAFIKELAKAFNSAFSTWANVERSDGTTGPLIWLDNIRYMTPQSGARCFRKEGGGGANPKLIWDISNRTMLPVRIEIHIFGMKEPIVKRMFTPAMLTGGGNAVNVKSPRQLTPVLTDVDVVAYNTRVKNATTGIYDDIGKIFGRFPKDKIGITRHGMDMVIHSKDKGIEVNRNFPVFINVLQIARKASQHALPATQTIYNDSVILPIFGIMGANLGINALELLLDGRKWFIEESMDKVHPSMLDEYDVMEATSPPLYCKYIKEPTRFVIGVERKEPGSSTKYLGSVGGALYFLSHTVDYKLKDLDEDGLFVLFSGIFRSKIHKVKGVVESRSKLNSWDMYLSQQWLKEVNQQVVDVFDDLMPEEPKGFAKFLAKIDVHPEWMAAASSISTFEGNKRMVVFDEFINSALSVKLNTKMLELTPSKPGEIPEPTRFDTVIKRAFGQDAFYKHSSVLAPMQSGVDNRLNKGALEAPLQTYKGGSGAIDVGAGAGKHTTTSIIGSSTSLTTSPALTTSSGGGRVVLNPFMPLDGDNRIVPTKHDIARLSTLNAILGFELQQIPHEFRGRADFSGLENPTK